VMCSWVVFRSANFAQAGRIFQGMFCRQAGAMVRDPVGPVSLMIAVGMVVAAHALVETGLLKKITRRLHPAAWGLGYAILIGLIVLLTPLEQKAFIYFQF